jgi:hypothetical protein
MSNSLSRPARQAVEPARAGQIGPIRREIEFEPLPQPGRRPEPAHEPAPEPEKPVPVPVPAGT